MERELRSLFSEPWDESFFDLKGGLAEVLYGLVNKWNQEGTDASWLIALTYLGFVEQVSGGRFQPTALGSTLVQVAGDIRRLEGAIHVALRNAGVHHHSMDWE